MKIHAEEIRKESFDDYSMDEVRKMVGFIEPSSDGKTWDVTTSDGGGMICNSQEHAVILAGVEEIKAKLFGDMPDEV